MRKIAVLPLDNRPCCYDFTKSFGEWGIVEVHQPPQEILGGFTEFGDSAKLTSWMKKIAPHMDGIIISVDQLAYGGLVPSRMMDKSYKEAKEIISVIKEIREKHPHLLIYAANVLMRISITAKNKLFSKYWRSIFSYSQVYDRVNRLQERELEGKLKKLQDEIPAEILDDYLEARKRNHKINKTMIEWVSEGMLDFLVITQEDASDVGIHLVEQEKLTKKIFDLNIQRKVLIYPGADEATQTLLARMVQNLKGYKIKIYPKYLSTYGKLQIAKFEDRTIEESVTSHIAASGAILIDDINKADVLLYINTPVGNEKDGNDSIIEKANYNSRHQLLLLIESIEYDLSQGRNVSIADITFPNASDKELVRFLLNENLFYRLFAYAGWNTAGNSLGTCISHSIIHFMVEKFEKIKETNNNHIGFMTERLLDEWAYQGHVRGEINNEILKELKIDSTNLEDHYEVVNEKVKNKMEPYINYLSDCLQRHYNSQKNLEVLTCELPWNRTFEIRVKVSVDY